MRFGEVTSLRFKDVNWDERTFYLETTKNGHSRTVSVPSEAMRVLAEYVVTICDRKDDQWIFRTSSGGKLSYVPNAIQNDIDLVANKEILELEKVAKEIDDPIKRQKMKQDIRKRKAVFHTFRHTLASWVVEAGGSLYDVQSLLGHRTVQMSARYAKFSQDHKRETLEKAISGVRV
jgi:integrase